MKKAIMAFVILCLGFMPIQVQAQEYTFADYKEALEQFNETYGTHHSLLTAQQFMEEGYDKLFKSYEDYQKEITSLSMQEFIEYWKEQDVNSVVNVQIDEPLTKASKASKSVVFNNKRNRMTLTYSYIIKSGVRYFNPIGNYTVACEKLDIISYFKMSSWKGALKNSNRRYTVTAKGKNYSMYGSTDKTFTINFDI